MGETGGVRTGGVRSVRCCDVHAAPACGGVEDVVADETVVGAASSASVAVGGATSTVGTVGTVVGTVVGSSVGATVIGEVDGASVGIGSVVGVGAGSVVGVGAGSVVGVGEPASTHGVGVGGDAQPGDTVAAGAAGSVGATTKAVGSGHAGVGPAAVGCSLDVGPALGNAASSGAGGGPGTGPGSAGAMATGSTAPATGARNRHSGTVETTRSARTVPADSWVGPCPIGRAMIGGVGRTVGVTGGPKPGTAGVLGFGPPPG